uniref:Uncharacterized protein n=1 Tax=Phytophthora ramorum TaxID=164328 RepID=H3GXZ7_PHYRM
MAAIVEDPPLELTQRTRAMDRELKPWALYDLSGAKSPGSLEEMTGYFRRFRALRGKSLTGVSHDALQRSWCAMIVRWNRMHQEGSNFVAWLTSREEVVSEHSLSELRARVCKNAWESDHDCYVHVREGCTSCESSERLSEEEWLRRVTEHPLSESEQSWIAKYRRTPSEVAQSTNRGVGRRGDTQRSPPPPRGRARQRSRSRSPQDRLWRRSRSRSYSRIRGQRPGHPGGVRSEDPTYFRPEGTRASVLGNVARSKPRAWSAYTYGYGHTYEVDPRAPQYGPRSSGYHQPSLQSAGDLRDDRARVLGAQDDVDEAVNWARDAQLDAEAAEERARRAEGAAAAARQTSAELRQRTRELERRVFGRRRRQHVRASGRMARMARWQGGHVGRDVLFMLRRRMLRGRRDCSCVVFLESPDVERRV